MYFSNALIKRIMQEDEDIPKVASDTVTLISNALLQKPSFFGLFFGSELIARCCTRADQSVTLFAQDLIRKSAALASSDTLASEKPSGKLTTAAMCDDATRATVPTPASVAR